MTEPQTPTINAYLLIFAAFHVLLSFTAPDFITPYPLIVHRGGIFLMGALTYSYLRKPRVLSAWCLMLLYTHSAVMETMNLITWSPNIYALNLFLAALDLLAATAIIIKVNRPPTYIEE